MKWFKTILVFVLALVSLSTLAQKERKYIREGNRDFDKSKYEESEISYRKAADLEENKSYKTSF